MKLLIPFLFLCSIVNSQVFFTKEELKTVARHNLERKACIETQKLNEEIIDSLNIKAETLETQLDYKDSIIQNYINVSENLKDIFQVQEKEIKVLNETINDQSSTIKKQNRKLTFWRIFSPISITASLILSFIL